jgi:hypothetical protein
LQTLKLFLSEWKSLDRLVHRTSPTQTTLEQNQLHSPPLDGLGSIAQEQFADVHFGSDPAHRQMRGVRPFFRFETGALTRFFDDAVEGYEFSFASGDCYPQHSCFGRSRKCTEFTEDYVEAPPEFCLIEGSDEPILADLVCVTEETDRQVKVGCRHGSPRQARERRGQGGPYLRSDGHSQKQPFGWWLICCADFLCRDQSKFSQNHGGSLAARILPAPTGKNPRRSPPAARDRQPG